jgi:EAL domain-containing protein (putative c-di-GMP-specific phosphodiesterase class I)
VVALAQRTGALVIGEGVEETAQLARLGALGVTAGQGYLLGRPEPLPLLPPRAVTVAGARSDAHPAGDAASPMSAWRRSMGLPAA